MATYSNKKQSQQRAVRKAAVKVEKRVLKDVRSGTNRTQRKAAKELVQIETAKTHPRVIRQVKDAERRVHSPLPASVMEQMEEQLAYSICAPGATAGIRYSDMSTKKTALCNPFEILPTSFGGTPTYTNYRALGSAEGSLFLFRNPLRAAVIYDANPQGLASNYYLPVNWPIVPNSQQTIVDYPFLVPANGFTAWHGARLFQALYSDHEGSYYFADAGEVFTFTVTNASGSNYNGSMALDTYTNLGYVPNAVVSATTTVTATFNFSYTFTTATYFRPRFVTGNVPGSMGSNNITIFSIQSPSGANSTSHFKHLCIKDLNNNFSAADEIRIIGLSAMFSNFQTQLNLGGQAAGLQAAGEDDWLTLVPTAGSSMVAAVQSSNDSALMNASTGLYGFLKPMDTSDFDFIDLYETNAQGTLVNAGYHLDGNPSYMCIAVASPTGVSTSGTWTLRYCIEYSSRDTWRNLDISCMPDETARRALDRTRYVSQFHENPKHLADVAKQVGQALKDGAKWVYNNKDLLLGIVKGVSMLAI